jgi:putative acetyltransferase
VSLGESDADMTSIRSWLSDEFLPEAINMTIAVERVIEPTPELTDLIAELDQTLGANYEPHQRHGISLAQIFEPHVRFFVARLDGVAMSCGGVALFDDYAEVKRMYTRPAARGRGLARAILAQIDTEALASGKVVLRLETGPHQHEAIGLYKSIGFKSSTAFGPYADMPAHHIEMSLFFEKTLRRRENPPVRCLSQPRHCGSHRRS